MGSNESIRTISGSLQATAADYAILVTRWYPNIIDNLLEGALKGLKQYQVAGNQITVIEVPGAVELPLIAQTVANTQKYCSMIALGCIIRGETSHFDYVASQCSQGLSQVQREIGIPIAFGVLTVDTMEQALERAANNDSNKGYEAALVALEMANLIDAIDE